jgi:NAD(P)-dependent dehydrogenase (short-subunit alcohol dehydrogenase family)
VTRLKNKTAIVVGAGQTPGTTIGNGRAMALLFAREGAEVLCVDRDQSRADETVAVITAEGGKARSVAADIVRADDVAMMFDTARSRWPRIDILVNNVDIGITGADADGPAHVASEQAFNTTLNVNLKGMWLTIKAAIPLMRDAGGGSIVNISALSLTVATAL